MTDYIVRATAADGQIRAFAAYTKDVVEEARRRHNTSPTATVALGQLLTAGTMMGAMMKNDTDILTLQILCDLTGLQNSLSYVWLFQSHIFDNIQHTKIQCISHIDLSIFYRYIHIRMNCISFDILLHEFRAGSIFRRTWRVDEQR